MIAGSVKVDNTSVPITERVDNASKVDDSELTMCTCPDAAEELDVPSKTVNEEQDFDTIERVKDELLKINLNAIVEDKATPDGHESVSIPAKEDEVMEVDTIRIPSPSKLTPYPDFEDVEDGPLSPVLSATDSDQGYESSVEKEEVIEDTETYQDTGYQLEQQKETFQVKHWTQMSREELQRFSIEPFQFLDKRGQKIEFVDNRSGFFGRQDDFEGQDFGTSPLQNLHGELNRKRCRTSIDLDSNDFNYDEADVDTAVEIVSTSSIEDFEENFGTAMAQNVLEFVEDEFDVDDQEHNNVGDMQFEEISDQINGLESDIDVLSVNIDRINVEPGQSLTIMEEDESDLIHGQVDGADKNVDDQDEEDQPFSAASLNSLKSVDFNDKSVSAVSMASEQ